MTQAHDVVIFSPWLVCPLTPHMAYCDWIEKKTVQRAAVPLDPINQNRLKRHKYCESVALQPVHIVTIIFKNFGIYSYISFADLNILMAFPLISCFSK